MGLIAKDDLFGEIWVNVQLLQNSISEHTALSMVVYFKFLDQGSRSKSRRKIRQVAERRSSCEREIDFGFSRTLSRIAAMFSADLAFRRRTGG